MSIKTKYYFIPLRLKRLNRWIRANTGKDSREPSYTAGGNINGATILEKNLEIFSEISMYYRETFAQVNRVYV